MRSTSPPQPPRRPAASEWLGATQLMLSLHLVCGWLPPAVIDHVAAMLDVQPRAVQDHFRDAAREIRRRRPWWPTFEQLRAVADADDFPAAFRTLLGSGVHAPYPCVEAALWEAPELLLGGLQARERARRDPSRPCPLCPDQSHATRSEAA